MTSEKALNKKSEKAVTLLIINELEPAHKYTLDNEAFDHKVLLKPRKSFRKIA